MAWLGFDSVCLGADPGMQWTLVFNEGLVIPFSD